MECKKASVPNRRGAHFKVTLISHPLRERFFFSWYYDPTDAADATDATDNRSADPTKPTENPSPTTLPLHRHAKAGRVPCDAEAAAKSLRGIISLLFVSEKHFLSSSDSYYSYMAYLWFFLSHMITI